MKASCDRGGSMTIDLKSSESNLIALRFHSDKLGCCFYVCNRNTFYLMEDSKESNELLTVEKGLKDLNKY